MYTYTPDNKHSNTLSLFVFLSLCPSPYSHFQFEIHCFMGFYRFIHKPVIQFGRTRFQAKRIITACHALPFHKMRQRISRVGKRKGFAEFWITQRYPRLFQIKKITRFLLIRQRRSDFFDFSFLLLGIRCARRSGQYIRIDRTSFVQHRIAEIYVI